MDRQESIFKNPKSQAILVAVGSSIVYLILTLRLGFPTSEDVTNTIQGLLTLNYAMIDKNLVGLILDMVLFSVGIVFWLAFFSQFVLPLHNIRERILAFRRLLSYLSGGHGPAIFIEDGEVHKRAGEVERKGPGIIILDTASAAVLRTPTTFTRAVGPGTVFTEKKETIAGAVDLHRQTQFIGPKRGENPFAEQAEEEPDEHYRIRRVRGLETRAQTRDGVEVIPNIIAIFRLKSKPGEGGTRFGYNPESVWKAVAREGVDPRESPGSAGRRVSWKYLPAYIAVDLWREYLPKFTLNELFDFSSKKEPGAKDASKTAFEVITKCIRDRMTQPEVQKLDDVGHPTGAKVPSREFKILEEHGLEAIAVVITNLRFPDSVEKKLVEQWKATWLKRAKDEHKQISWKRSYEKHRGEQLATIDFSEAASELLGEELLQTTSPDEAPGLASSLELLVRGTHQQCIEDPELHQHLTNEKGDMASLIEWIRRN